MTSSAATQHPSEEVASFEAQLSPSISSSSHPSRVSTPPTELSSTVSSPTFALPVETAESQRRREQSDTASSEIGKRLLKGWAMLAEECSNVRCFGVPLVRPPKAGGGKDPRMECVICGTVYVRENDAIGRERLVPVNDATGSATDPVREDAILASSSGQSLVSVPHEKGKSVIRDVTSPVSKIALSSPTVLATTAYFKPGQVDLPIIPGASVPRTETQTYQTNTSVPALEVTAKSLELSLHTLSERMTFLSNGHNPLDLSSIALTADTIGKVAQALAQVKQLHWSESRVSS